MIISPPAFYDQARALIEDQQFEEALEKIAYALKVAPNQAEYRDGSIVGNSLLVSGCFINL
jgi:hypothetical protein